MDKRLSHLLHELIDHAVPQGNKRGELHGLVDDMDAPLVTASNVTSLFPDGTPESDGAS
jgi:hypothetical protein